MNTVVVALTYKKVHDNIIFVAYARIAQSVEQWTENPRVTSSNLVPGIHFCYVMIIYVSNHFLLINSNFFYLI